MRGAKYLLVALVVMMGLAGCCGSYAPPKFPMGVAMKLTGTKGCRFYGHYESPYEHSKVDSIVPVTYTLIASRSGDKITGEFCINSRVDSLGNVLPDTLFASIWIGGKLADTSSVSPERPCLKLGWSAPWF